MFPLEADAYRRAGADVRFVGHPLLDLVSPKDPGEKESARKELGLGSEEVIGLLPGSRNQEIKLLLPTMLQAASLVKDAKPGAEFLLPLSHTVSRDLVQEQVEESGLPVRIVSGAAHRCMGASDALIVASGTCDYGSCDCQDSNGGGVGLPLLPIFWQDCSWTYHISHGLTYSWRSA